MAETHAGFDNLIAQADPGISYLQSARKDLAAEYGALDNAPLAARLQQEQDLHEAR